MIQGHEIQRIINNAKSLDTINIDVLKSLTPKQWLYAIEYAKDPNATKQALCERLSIDPSTVWRWGSAIDDAITAIKADMLQSTLAYQQSLVLEAMAVLAEDLHSDDKRLRNDTARYIIDRNLGKAQQSINMQSLSLNLSGALSDLPPIAHTNEPQALPSGTDNLVVRLLPNADDSDDNDDASDASVQDGD